MGLFSKSEEEKKQEELKKFNKEQEKIKEALKALGVDFDSASDEELRDSNNKNAWFVKSGMPYNLQMEIIINATLKSYERLSLMRLDNIIYQNFILIRQNELITRYLKKIHDVLKKEG